MFNMKLHKQKVSVKLELCGYTGVTMLYSFIYRNDHYGESVMFNLKHEQHHLVLIIQEQGQSSEAVKTC